MVFHALGIKRENKRERKTGQIVGETNVHTLIALHESERNPGRMRAT